MPQATTDDRAPFFPRLVGRRLRALSAALLIGLGGLGLSGCETAPATGRTIFTGGLDAQDELALGREQHPKMVAQFGGTYDDPELNRYVTSVGNLLAATSEQPDLPYRFTILDSNIVNAFALPGGYVYVSRGLVNLARDEAELAGVLAHEIGHVTARHSAERYGNSVLAGLAVVGAAILTGDANVGQFGGQAAQLALASYSRSQESEADLLGIRYLSRAGYDPDAMAGFLSQMESNARLEATLAGNPGQADAYNIMQTHPRTADRVRDAARQAGVTQVANPMRNRDTYLRRIDGTIHGDSPRQGYVRGQRFLHPELKFAFEAPPGFRLANRPTSVQAKHPNGSMIVFDMAGGEVARRYEVGDYLRGVWGKNARLEQFERIEINGMKAATATTKVNLNSGPGSLRLLAIRFAPNQIVRFLFVVPSNRLDQMNRPLRETTYSFRRLSDGEAASLKPYRIRIHEVRPGESLSSLARRLPYPDYREERLRVLNGLRPGEGLQVGQKIKLIVEE